MANTFKFGNGNWATKEDSVLAYNDENNNFKPLPFDFTRASTATYVDKNNQIVLPAFAGTNIKNLFCYYRCSCFIILYFFRIS